jgi:hypothetical protein
MKNISRKLFVTLLLLSANAHMFADQHNRFGSVAECESKCKESCQPMCSKKDNVEQCVDQCEFDCREECDIELDSPA